MIYKAVPLMICVAATVITAGVRKSKRWQFNQAVEEDLRYSTVMRLKAALRYTTAVLIGEIIALVIIIGLMLI